VIAASWLGKAKTGLQIAAILLLIGFDPSPLWVDMVLYAAVAMTLISGADYFFGIRRHMGDAPSTPAPAVPAKSP